MKKLWNEGRGNHTQRRENTGWRWKRFLKILPISFLSGARQKVKKG